MALSTNKQERKERPIARGVLSYFPNAIAEVANVSFVGNQQHNPGEELHWSRGKSDDHADCIARHLIERGTIDDDGVRHSAKAAWRALAMLQIELEAEETPDPLRFLESLGCPLEVAQQIRSGMTPSPLPGGPTVYLAGPMRGYEHFNFPAFDAVRDALLKRGFNMISPADIDRAAGDVDETKTTYTVTQADFAFRDFWSLYFLRKIGDGNGIVLLNGWHRSTGATAEFFLARWLGLKIFSQDGSEITEEEAMRAFYLHV